MRGQSKENERADEQEYSQPEQPCITPDGAREVAQNEGGESAPGVFVRACQNLSAADEAFVEFGAKPRAVHPVLGKGHIRAQLPVEGGKFRCAGR